MTASQMEVERLEKINQDLANEYNRLEDIVKTVSERNGCLESDLRDVQCREEQLKEENEVAREKLLALEETIAGSESKVVCLHFFFHMLISF